MLDLEGDAIAFAGALKRVVDYLGVRLPVAENLVEPIRRKVSDEFSHPRFG
jgi:hypothetical protein